MDLMEFQLIFIHNLFILSITIVLRRAIASVNRFPKKVLSNNSSFYGISKTKI